MDKDARRLLRHAAGDRWVKSKVSEHIVLCRYPRQHFGSEAFLASYCYGPVRGRDENPGMPVKDTEDIEASADIFQHDLQSVFNCGATGVTGDGKRTSHIWTYDLYLFLSLS